MAEQKPEIVVSFEGVKMKEFRAYWAAVVKGDWMAQDAFFARVVRSWNYPLDSSDQTSYGELELKQYLTVQQAIRVLSVETTHLLRNYQTRGTNENL
jgi:hypothetical protein